MFWFFSFSKKIIISNKKNRKTNNLNFKNNFRQKPKDQISMKPKGVLFTD